jgi:hypothetical protein
MTVLPSSEKTGNRVNDGRFVIDHFAHNDSEQNENNYHQYLEKTENKYKDTEDKAGNCTDRFPRVIIKHIR